MIMVHAGHLAVLCGGLPRARAQVRTRVASCTRCCAASGHDPCDPPRAPHPRVRLLTARPRSLP